MPESSPGALSQIESAGDVNVANLRGVRCDRRAAGGRDGHEVILGEQSLWRPKTCLRQIYMIFDRRRVGVIK